MLASFVTRHRLKSGLALQSPPTRTNQLVRVAIRARRVPRRFSESRQADFVALAETSSLWAILIPLA